MRSSRESIVVIMVTAAETTQIKRCARDGRCMFLSGLCIKIGGRSQFKKTVESVRGKKPPVSMSLRSENEMAGCSIELFAPAQEHRPIGWEFFLSQIYGQWEESNERI